MLDCQENQYAIDVTFHTDLHREVGICLLRKKESNYELWNFIVENEFRNQGFGTQFLKEIIEFLSKSGAGKLGLFVNRNNKIALHVYQKLGFTEVPDDPNEERRFYDKNVIYMDREI